MIYLIKTPSEQDTSIKIMQWMENKFAICSADVLPTAYPYIVEFIEPHYDNMYLYEFSVGKRHKCDIFGGRVKMNGPLQGHRWIPEYTDVQLAERLALHQWMALTVFLEDMVRMGLTTEEDKKILVEQINSINSDIELRDFIKTNLYYDL